MSCEIKQGHVLDVLRGMPDESVHCCVTSPPYFGLRSYGTEPQTWGGSIGCVHEWVEQICTLCGAWCGEYGQEPTVPMYVEHTVEIFREIHRVLRADGTSWLNIGDSYNAAGRSGHGTRVGYKQGTNRASATGEDGCRPSCDDLKPKELLMVPARVALALQASGWYLRQDIIWSKKNPMPESVTDRCTKAHEYIYLLTKSERYFYDNEAIKELSVTCDPRRPYTSEDAWQMDGRPDEQRHGGEPRSFKGSQFNKGKTAEHQLGRASKKPRTAGNKTHKYVTAYNESETEEHRTKAGLLAVADVPWEYRNKRSVWEMATQPYEEAHFATFPEELPETCIRAGCPEGGTVLDPFNGSGTTGVVALRLGRSYIGVELNPEYAAMAQRRIVGDAPLFNEVMVAGEAAGVTD